MEWLKQIGKIYRKDGDDIYIEIQKKDIPTAITILKNQKITHISSITGTDTTKEIEVIYHFTKDENTINIKTKINRDTPELKTITKEFPGAILYEKELAEMLGINIEGIKTGHFLLSKDSPLYPHRKD